MTYKEKIIEFCNNRIAALGIGAEFETSEFNKGINSTNFHPSDYCYNIINKAVVENETSYPPLFKRVEENRYKCLGIDYPYDGVFTHLGKPIGEWKNGKRVYY